MKAKHIILSLVEGRLLKDYRTDKSHYVAINVRDDYHPEYPGVKQKSSLDSNLTGYFILGPATSKELYPTRRKFEQDYPIQHADAEKKIWRRLCTYCTAMLEVDHAKKLVNLDPAQIHQRKSRRNGDEGEKSYTILDPEDDVGKHLYELKKLAADVAKLDPAILSFTVVGHEALGDTVVSQFVSQRSKDPVQHFASGKHDFTMYHGTSMNRWREIQKRGLLPGMAPMTYCDLVKNYSEFNVYLSTTQGAARNYASRAAIDDNSSAAVLQVTVHDATKFVPDEDVLHWLAYMGDEGLKYVQKTGLDVHMKHSEWKSKPEAAEIWKIYMSQTKSSLKHGTIAYRGRILPKDVKLIQTYKPVRMSKDPGDVEFNAAMDKTRQSAIRH